MARLLKVRPAGTSYRIPCAHGSQQGRSVAPSLLSRAGVVGGQGCLIRIPGQTNEVSCIQFRPY